MCVSIAFLITTPSSNELAAKATVPTRTTFCRELTTLWVARLNDGTELKVTDPKEQQGDVEEEETKGEERRDGVDGG